MATSVEHGRRESFKSDRTSNKSTDQTRRIDILAQHKTVHPAHIDDRRSVYWVDKQPPKPQSGGTTEFTVTERQNELSQHRPIHSKYQSDRPTPIWSVAEGAKQAEASPRVSELAAHRNPHSLFQPERPVYTKVSEEAMSAEPSDRIVQLSAPKPHKIWHNSQDTYRDPDFTRPITVIDTAALKAKLTPRVGDLAEPKMPHPQFEPEKPVRWPVSDNARNAIATLRLQQLARPKSARLRVDDYDAYKVTSAARSARATQRLTELATPIARKQRVKKL